MEEDVLRIGKTWRVESNMQVGALHELLARMIIELYEQDVLRKKLTQEFYFTDEQEITAIIKYAIFLLNDGDIHEDLDLNIMNQVRVDKIKRELTSFLAESEVLHMEGFYRFRLKGLWNSYNKIIETAIDEYMMEKEYRDYITYLRGLVRDRTRLIPFLHLISRSEYNYQLLDEHGEEVDFEQIYVRAKTTQELDIIYDDQLISRLIAINPGQIQLHQFNFNDHVAQSLKNIFEDRLTYCNGCRSCREEIEHQG